LEFVLRRSRLLEPLLTTEEVAVLVRRSPGTVKNWRHLHKGPRHVVIEGGPVYWLTDVEAYIDARRSPARRDSGDTPTRYRASSIDWNGDHRG
jgi:hypothetical protein